MRQWPGGTTFLTNNTTTTDNPNTGFDTCSYKGRTPDEARWTHFALPLDRKLGGAYRRDNATRIESTLRRDRDGHIIRIQASNQHADKHKHGYASAACKYWRIRVGVLRERESRIAAMLLLLDGRPGGIGIAMAFESRKLPCDIVCRDGRMRGFRLMFLITSWNG